MANTDIEKEKKLTCSKCTFTSNNLKEHFSRDKFANRSAKMVCKRCKNKILKQQVRFWEKKMKCDKYNYETDLKKHKKQNHVNKMYFCINCDYGTNDKGVLKHHNLIHMTSEQLYKCSSCSYSTKIKFDFMNHQKLHVVANELKCKYCSYVTNVEFSLKRHMTSHTKEKLYKCPKCDFATNAKSILMKHGYMHQNEFIYACREHKSKSRNKLETHKLKCCLNKKFSCIECGYRTHSNTSFRHHKLYHLNGILSSPQPTTKFTLAKK